MAGPYIPRWVTTAEACTALDCDPSTLRRHVDRKGGVLQWGTHWIYRNGTKQSGCNWDVARIAQVLQIRPHNRRKHDIPTSPSER